MVAVGQEMTNARSGERFVWRATRESTGGAYCEFDLHLDADAKVAAPHRHPHQVEQFTVVTGQFLLVKDGRQSVLHPSEVGLVPVGAAHKWQNISSQPAHVVVRLTPALDIEDYFEKFCAIATEGKAGPTGLPGNPLQLAVLLDGYRQEFEFATPTQQRLLSPLLSFVARIGRRRGYRDRIDPAAA